jgi:hypothetical protein
VIAKKGLDRRQDGTHLPLHQSGSQR